MSVASASQHLLVAVEAPRHCAHLRSFKDYLFSNSGGVEAPELTDVLIGIILSTLTC